jgi:hypothetical protein
VFCRDEMDSDLSELVIVVSNSHIEVPLPGGPAPRLLAEEIGCDFVDGWATSRLRIKNETQDMTFVSSRVPLSFKPRSIQDQPGNVQFDLMSTSVTWTASGTTGDCTVEGRAIVNIPAYLDQPLDPTRTAWGYMNVVGQDGGDFHSIQIPAVDSGLMMKKTCPGDPPRVSMEPMGVVHLLNILTHPNTHSGNAVVYAGTQTFDPERFQDSLPQQALEVLKNFPQASDVLNRRGGRMVYSFEWELRPRSGTPQGK